MLTPRKARNVLLGNNGEHVRKWPNSLCVPGVMGTLGVCWQGCLGFSVILMTAGPKNMTEDKAEAQRGDMTGLRLCIGHRRPEGHSPSPPTYLDVLHETVAFPAAGEGLACGCQG